MSECAERQPPRGRRFVLRGGLILSMDPAIGDLRGDILVIDGRVREVAPAIAAGDAETVEVAHCVVLPGFVDSHRHTWQTAIRHMGTDWDLPRMFVELFLRYGPNYRPKDVYACTLFGRLAALDGGITTLLDWAHIQNSPDHADEAIRALRECGARAIFAHGQPGHEPQKWMKDSHEPHPADIRRLRKQVLSSDDALVTLAMAARGPEFTTMDIVAHDVGLARDLGIRTSIHIGLGTNGPRVRGIERMHARGLLGPDLTFLHCCTCSDHEMRLLAQTGATAAVSAQIAMLSGGFGLPATGRLIAAGVEPSLSIDSEMTASGDMFSEMRATLEMDRVACLHRLDDFPDRAPMTARDVLRLATVAGAKAVGLDGRIGTITPGKLADIVLIDATALNLAPLADPCGALVMAGHGGNVVGVMVEGRPVKWNGRLLTVDTLRAIEALNQARDYLAGRLSAVPH